MPDNPFDYEADDLESDSFADDPDASLDDSLDMSPDIDDDLLDDAPDDPDDGLGMDDEAVSDDDAPMGDDLAPEPPSMGTDSPRPRGARRSLGSRSRIRGARGAGQAWDKEVTRELFRRYKEEGDTSARAQLVENHLNLVRHLASKFKNRGESLEDLIQVGSLGLVKAIDRFEPERGLEFTTFATPTIMGEIKRHFRDKGWAVRVPRRLQELSAKVNKATDELTSELSRTPSVVEVAERVGASVEEVLEAMESSSAYSSVSLDARSGTDDESRPVIDTIEVFDQHLLASDDRMLLEDILRNAPARERDVIMMRFFEGLTQVEIAERMGISQVQVSRLLRKTLKKVQEKLDPDMHA